MSEEKKHVCDEGCNCEEHDCHDGCDCGCEDDLVILQDENGNDVAFHYVYTMEHEGKDYVFLQAADDEDDCVEIFALQTVEEDGEYYDTLDPVDDDLYDVLYEKLLLVAAEDCCEDDDECHDEHCDCHHDHKKK